MPREIEPSWEDGIRSVRPDEFDSLGRLIGDVFFPGLVEHQPHVFNTENAGNLRVVVKNGEVVSHIATIRRYASIFGCAIRAAPLGGVATYEAHRGNGYATSLFEDTMNVCREDGVDLMLVSGYRNMYHRLGCRVVGKDWLFKLPAELGNQDANVEVSLALEEDIDELMGIYRGEAVRWIRPRSDFEFMLDGWVMNRSAQTWLVSRGGHGTAFLVLQKTDEKNEGCVRLLDFAGDRNDLVLALTKLAADLNLASIEIHVMGCDTLLGALLKDLGLVPKPTTSSGTVLVLQFEQFMDRMCPYFGEVLGEAEAGGLIFEESGNEMIFQYGADRLIARNRGEASQIIFGTPDNSEGTLYESAGAAGEVFQQIFPIPALWCGVNYV